MDRPIIYFVLLLTCILSRLFTGINYIEDNSSLAISLNITNVELLPSFINLSSPLFCACIKFLAFITRNFSTSFSIAGGVSTFIIIYFSLKLIKVPLASLEGGLVGLIIFFNPLLWIASNRYTPEIEATAITLASFYFLMSSQSKGYQTYIGWLLAGLLGGFCTLLLPFLILPLIYNVTARRQIAIPLVALGLGLLIWILPALIFGLPHTLHMIATATPLASLSDMSLSRIFTFIKDIWASGLGGFWWQRSVFTILTSLALLPCLFFGTIILLSFEYPQKKLFTLWGSAALYLIWLYLQQQTYTVSVLIFMPFLSIIIGYGIIYFLVNFNLLLVKVGVALFLLLSIWGCIYMALDHMKPNAAEQLRQHLINNMKNPATIISSKEFYKYLSLQGVQADAYLPNNTERLVIAAPVLTSDKIIAHQKPKNTFKFQHNPYVSRQWSWLELKEY